MDALIGVTLIGGLFAFLLWPGRYASYEKSSRSQANKVAVYNQMVAMRYYHQANSSEQLNGCPCYNCQGIRSVYEEQASAKNSF